MKWIQRHIRNNDRQDESGSGHAKESPRRDADSGMFRAIELVDKQIGNAVTRLSDR